MLIGALSFILPRVGIQFRLISLFGNRQTEAAIAFVVIGAIMLVASMRRGKSPADPARPPAPAVPVKAPPAAASAPVSSIPPSAGNRSCSKCGARADANDGFCMQCGTRLPATAPAAASPVVTPSAPESKCPKCGAKIGPEDRFCNECGAAVSAIVAAPPPAPQTTPVIQPLVAPPKRRRKTGCLIFLVVLLLLIAGGTWVFFGLPKFYRPPARTEPAVPARLAGTLTEFPVDSAPTQPLQPTEVVSQSFESASPGGTAAQTIQASAESFPPGLNTGMIPQVASALTSATYRGEDPQAPPVYVQVLESSQSATLAGQFAQSVAQSSGGSLQGASVQNPQGQIYQGYTVRSATILVYFFVNPYARNVIILYAPQPQAFAATTRLAGSVGNGRGLRDYPQVADTYGALPGAPPPGYQLASVRGFTRGQLNAALSRLENGAGRNTSAQLNQALNAIRVLIPERGTLATYRNGRGDEKGVLIGAYGSHFRARMAWRTLYWTFGWAMHRNNSLGYDALTITNSDARILIFQKGPYIGLTKVPSASDERELFDLTTSVQF